LAKGVSGEFQGCFKRVSKVFQVSRNFQGCFEEVFKDVLRKFQLCFEEVSRTFQKILGFF